MDASAAWPTVTAVACAALALMMWGAGASAQPAPGGRATPASRSRGAAKAAPRTAEPADAKAALAATANPAGNPASTDVSPTTAPVAQAAPAVQRPAPVPIPDDPNVLTDEKIGASIKKAVDFLYKQFDPKTHLVSDNAGKIPDTSYLGGLDALCLYALMQGRLALVEVKDPRLDFKGPEMRAMVAAMEQVDLSKGGSQTYAHGLRATALELFLSTLHLPEGRDARPNEDTAAFLAAVAALQDDCAYCLYACDGGAYTYSHKMPARNGIVISGDVNEGPRNAKELLEYYTRLNLNNLPGPKRGWDNSNSQYGLLGVWSAVDAEVGIEVPFGYWVLVDNHWRQCQERDGGWSYGRGQGPNTTLSMTCAGLASEFVCHEYLEPVHLQDKVGRVPFSPSIKAGLAWFEKGDNSIREAPGNGYTLYGVERVGLASGFKFFGQHDWYRELAAKVVASQQPNGAYPGGHGDVINTAYSLLFLARGRHPIVMNKLRFDSDGKNGIGYWLNRPRDAANLARYVGKQLERPLNWQVINVDTDWAQWLDSPIMEIASHKEVKFTPEQLAKLRNFVEAGGLLYVQADGDASEFNKMIPGPEGLAHALFPQYELEDVKPDSPLFSTESGVYKIPARRGLKMVSNGSRILMLWSQHDIAKYWHLRDDKRHKWELQFGTNLFVYAAGKRDLRNRLDSPYVPPVTTAPIDTIKVARLQYSGNWDPEPGAWRRYVNLFQKQTGTKLDLATVDLASLKPGQAALAVLTGTARYGFSPGQVAAVKAYVEAGGALVIDTTGGTGQFGQSVSTLLSQAFPGALPQGVSANHPVLAGGTPGTENLAQTRPQRYRPATKARGLARGTSLQEIRAGKGHVVFTDLDITSGLLSTATGGILGYDPAFSESLMKNLIFWSVDGQSDTPVRAAPAAAQAAPAAPIAPEAPAATAAQSTPAAAPAAPPEAAPAPRVGPRSAAPVRPKP